MDLKDFFPSVSSKQVYNIFRLLGYNEFISKVFTNICTYRDCLPQGGPCSPMLANLATWMLDLRIQGYVGKRGINYTRYADDLSFSGLNPSKVVRIIPMIKQIILGENFKINDKKTRIASSARAKIVTGLIINGDNIGIGRLKYKLLRAKIHHLALQPESDNDELFDHVKGWISYLNSVDKIRHAKAEKYILELSKKYPKSLLTKIIV